MNFLGALLLWLFIGWIFNTLSGGQTHRRASSAKHAVLEGLGKLLAFVAKADGRISRSEVDVATGLVRSLGLPEDERQICVQAFNSVKIFDFETFTLYAHTLAGAVNEEFRAIVYEMLWMVAAADGTISQNEADLLRYATDPLGLNPGLFYYFRHKYAPAGGRSNASAPRQADELELAYTRLGCKSSDSNEKLRSSYKKLAMRYHPDRLRAEGLPEAMLAQANRTMAEINAAWDTVKKARNI